MLSRSTVESYTLEKLQEELHRAGVKHVPNDHIKCVNMVLALWEHKQKEKISMATETPIPSLPPGSAYTHMSSDQGAVAGPPPDVATILDRRFSQLNSMLISQMQAQQQIFAQMIAAANNPATCQTTPSVVPETSPPLERMDANASFHETFSSATANATKFLSSQIAQFSGSEQENVELWIDKIESVAAAFQIPATAILFAATSKLTKAARKWYDFSHGQVSSSWDEFKSSIIRRFKKEIFFTSVMEKVCERKWLHYKETFQDYAMEKIALMECLKLPPRNIIHCLIDGIIDRPIRSTATLIETDSLDIFLEKMYRVTSSCSIQSKKPVVNRTPYEKSQQDSTSRPASPVKTSKDTFCVYCRAKGHTRDECIKLKKKEQFKRFSSSSTVPNKNLTPPVASVTSAPLPPSSPEQSASLDRDSSSCIACVQNNADKDRKKLIVNSTTFKVTEFNKSNCEISAFFDTGSPVSFISFTCFKKFCSNQSLTPSDLSFKAINGTIIPIKGMFQTTLRLEALNNSLTSIHLHVLENNLSFADILIGRDFINFHKIQIIIDPSTDHTNITLQLLAEVASADVLIESDSPQEQFMQNIKVDFDGSTKDKLLSVIQEVENLEVPIIDDNHSVRINLKDESVYAFAPRRLAYSERMEIRKIIDDLLERKIIKESISPYCSRIVPVRKKNGSLRLCIDLRPLNERVHKQKYPFPIIEDILSRIGNKSVFTLLDLKDSFHQLKVQILPNFSLSLPRTGSMNIFDSLLNFQKPQLNFRKDFYISSES